MLFESRKKYPLVLNGRCCRDGILKCNIDFGFRNLIEICEAL